MRKFTQKDIDEINRRVAFDEALRAGTQRRRELMKARSALNRSGQYPTSYEQAVISAMRVGYFPGKKSWVEALGRLMKCPPDVVRQHIAGAQATDKERALEAPPINVDKLLADHGVEIPEIDFDDHLPL
ncbi:MAG: hypothetical protein MK208_01660 [Shimia sp.]|uniref:hypothetical protein n=1 Tax=Shimia sp. TaxID=1954381 RepID=UPI0025DA19B2|nr:hypothetical protein [Shimia sp.]MCH2065913.1 hypothetical protein [Shimia sp.]